MSVPHLRFTIRGLMIAVVVVAGLLALPDGWRQFATVLALPCLALLADRWLLLQGHRHIAAFCFWVPAILANASFVALCISPTGWLPYFLVAVCLLIILPTILGFGTSWATLAAREAAATRFFPRMAWTLVIVMSILPLATAVTLWPLRLVFLTAKPALERLADQVATGRSINYPRWAGPFRIAGSIVDPATGDVGLMIDPDLNGPTAFVRNSGTRSGPFGCYRPIRGDVLDIGLGDKWCYHVED